MSGPPQQRRAAVAPDFYLVGHPKCGTTSIYEMLRAHPRVFMPELKEPWFFSADQRPRFQPDRSGGIPETLEEYAGLFADAPPGALTGEASTSYLRSREAAARIAEVRPDARIVAIFREPTEFLRSLHGQLLLDHIETEKDLGHALALEPARREGRNVPRRSHIPQMLAYSDHVRYAEQLRRYHAAFAPEQVLTLIYEDFNADNEGAARAVLRFLGLDDGDPVAISHANASRLSMRSQRLDDMLNQVTVGRGPVSRAVKASIKAVVPAGARARAVGAVHRNVVRRPARAPDAELMAELRRRYRGEAEALSEYLGRDLISLWGYDRLG